MRTWTFVRHAVDSIMTYDGRIYSHLATRALLSAGRESDGSQRWITDTNEVAELDDCVDFYGILLLKTHMLRCSSSLGRHSQSQIHVIHAL